MEGIVSSTEFKITGYFYLPSGSGNNNTSTDSTTTILSTSSSKSSNVTASDIDDNTISTSSSENSDAAVNNVICESSNETASDIDDNTISTSSSENSDLAVDNDNVIINLGIGTCNKFIEKDNNKECAEEMWRKYVSTNINISEFNTSLIKIFFFAFNMMKRKKDQDKIKPAFKLLVKYVEIDEEVFEKQFEKLFKELDIMFHWTSTTTTHAERYWDFKNRDVSISDLQAKWDLEEKPAVVDENNLNNKAVLSNKASVRNHIHSQRNKAKERFIQLQDFIYPKANLYEPPTKKIKTIAKFNLNSICKYYGTHLVENNTYEFKIQFTYEPLKKSQNVTDFSTTIVEI